MVPDDAILARIRRLWGSGPQPTEPPTVVAISLRKPSKPEVGFAARAGRMFLDGREPTRKRPTKQRVVGQMVVDFEKVA